MESVSREQTLACDRSVFASMFHVGVDFDDDAMEYADQSYISNDIKGCSPEFPSTNEEDETSTTSPSIPKKPEEAPPLPPELVDVKEPRKEHSIDEILELSPPNGNEANGKELMKKIGNSITKMKDQTASTLNRLLRRTSDTNTDLLGMQSMEENAATSAPFNADIDFVHVDSSEPASNDDVADLFGLVSLDTTACAEGDSDEEGMQVAEKKTVLEESDRLALQLQVLTLSKQITAAELKRVEERAAINKKGVERVLQCYIESWACGDGSNVVASPSSTTNSSAARPWLCRAASWRSR